MEKRIERKKSKKSRKFEHKQDLSIDAKRNLKFLDIDNCFLVFLSPQTQKYIGCRIGDQVTPERPWVYVKREKIEDSLFLYEHKSEFYNLRMLIENYPEDEMLIGSYKTSQESIEEFLICTSIEAKFKILELEAKEKKNIKDRVERLIYLKANKWKSYGSEIEVDGSQNVNNRFLFEILLGSNLPIIIGVQKVRFRYRLASLTSKIPTYDEILPDRRFYKQLVFKIRIDKASQITPEKQGMESQTTLAYPTHKYTQTDEIFHVLELIEPENIILDEGLKKILDFTEDSLLVNFHINLHNTDYKFPNAYIRSYESDSKELIRFQDVINCKDLLYGSVSWNAMISGLLAVSYVEYPKKLIVKQDFSNRISPRNFQDNMVLLWCYSDNLAPKLYMHCNFEITTISFCPYDENILVGGGSGGQIVVWDLRDKLKEAETKEYLTSPEQNNRNLVRTHTNWMKWPPGVRHVFPTIVSDISESHKSPVISIQWFPSYHSMSKLGQVENNQPPVGRTSYLEPTKSYQFLTCSMEDSYVLAWEIKQSLYMVKETPPKKKHKRLSRLPKSLIEGISPLKRINKNFHPFFKMKLDVPQYEKRMFTTHILLKNPVTLYQTLNPDSLGDYRERTFFQEIIPRDTIPHSQEFVACSITGYMATCAWTQNNFDQGREINEQVCDMKVFLAIHDGPILSCLQNPFYSECILTIGGSVFGIWITSADKIEKLRKPIIWRKGPCRYVSGFWSLRYPVLCTMLREDNYLESWDLVDYTVKPIRRVKLKGSQIMDVLADPTRTHARKRTYLLTDTKGAIKVQDLPVFSTKSNKEEVQSVTIETLNNIYMRKRHVKKLNDRLKKKYNFSCMHIRGAEPFVNKSELFESSKYKLKGLPYRATKWQRKEEERMYETLLQQKGINVKELEKHTVPLMEKLSKRIRQQEKIDRKLARKDEIYSNERKFLLESSSHVGRRKISISFPLEMEKVIKQQYIEDYKLIEKEALQNIANAAERLTINWGAVLNKRKNDVCSIRRTPMGSIRISVDPLILQPRKTMLRIISKSMLDVNEQQFASKLSQIYE